MPPLYGCEIWITSGHGTKKFSGCNAVSSFCGIGKKTAWTARRSMPHLTPLFARLSHEPCEVSFADMEQIERFVVVLYQKHLLSSK